MKNLNGSSVFKLILTGIFAFLVLVFGTFCAIQYFQFTPANFGEIVGSIGGVFLAIGFGEHKTNPANSKPATPKV